jgi:hypothetical protein
MFMGHNPGYVCMSVAWRGIPIRVRVGEATCISKKHVSISRLEFHPMMVCREGFSDVNVKVLSEKR